MEKLRCSLTKDEILAAIIDEFNKDLDAAKAHPESHAAIYRLEAMRDLLHRIPIYDT